RARLLREARGRRERAPVPGVGGLRLRLRDHHPGDRRAAGDVAVALNRDLIGKEYGDVEFEVERDRIVQFADAIGDDDPRYRSDEPIAPPTFPTVLQIATGGQIVLDPELGLDYSRVVHVEQEYVMERPLRAGDHLVATP